MLVLVAGKDPLAAVGGHQSYVRAHALAAATAGFEPHVFCVTKGKGETVDTDFGVLHRVASPVRPVRHPMAPLHAPYLGAAIGRCLGAPRRGVRELIHGFGPWGYVAATVAASRRRRGGAAVAVSSAYTTLEHDWRGKLAGLGWQHGAGKRLRYEIEMLWIRAWAARCERRGYDGSRLVLVNYETVRRLLVDTYGVRAEIRRLPYASPAAFGAAPDEPELPTALPAIAGLRPATAPLIVVVARHDPRKGLDILLRCLGDLRRAGIPFRACLVGPGTLLAAHRELAARLGLGATTALPGYVEDPFAYLLHADLFVLPTLEEGSGSVALLEALQAGCAVVATACDGIPEDLVHGDSALLVPPGDVGALRGALLIGLVDGALRRRLAAGARAVYETRFSPQAFVAALAATYADLGLTPG